MPYFDGPPRMQHWQSGPGPTAGAIATSNGSFFVAPMDPFERDFPANMVANTFILGLSYSWTSNLSASFASSYRLGLYARSASTLNLLNSASGTFGPTSTNTGNSSLFNGARFLSIGTAAWSKTPNFNAGQHYYLAVQFLSAVTTTSLFIMHVHFSHISSFSGGLYTVGAPNASNMPWAPFRGVFNATTTAVPATMEASQFTGTGGLLSALYPFVRIDDDFKNWIG